MEKTIIKYFQGPTFTALEWSTRNPYLQRGEVGYLLEGSIVTKAKVGPGHWNDLGFISNDRYSYSGNVLAPIGDASGDLNGQLLGDIVYKMLNPYQVPALSNIVNNASGSFVNESIIEIGRQVTGPVTVQYQVSNPSNLISSPPPINVSAAGVFSNEGNFANLGYASLTLAAPLAPISLYNVTISLTATHLKGTSPVARTYLRFYPKTIWFSSSLASIPDSATFMAQSGQNSRIAGGYLYDYSFPGNGYSWLAVPSMLSPTGLIFTDVTVPSAPYGYAMSNVGNISINNGVGNYSYQLYRSDFKLINPTVLRVTA